MTRITSALLLLAVLSLAPNRASAQIAILSAGVEEHDASAGESYQGTIRVRNTSSEPQRVRAYLTDYEFFADGRSDYGSAGQLVRSSAAWISFASADFMIAAQSDALIAYTVHVPASPELRGTYSSMVMVESGEDAGVAAVTDHRLGIRTRVRHGIQLATHVGSGTTDLAFGAPRFGRSDEGPATLEFDLENPGERAWRATLVVEIYDALGAVVTRLTETRGLLYPGSSLRQHFQLPALPSGTYRVILTADTGDEVFGAQFRLIL